MNQDFVSKIKNNIALTNRLFKNGETPEVIGTVCGSTSAQAFWKTILDRARSVFKAEKAISFHEDLPTNQAFGLLLLWQRLKEHVTTKRGAMVAFVFGDGTRSTPFTETDNAQKPAIATYVKESPEPDARFLTMVEVALRYFTPVQQFLTRSGFEGLVVKWGDEVQIPTLDLSGTNDLFAGADIVRFVSIREISEDEAANKDWVGVDENSHVTAFIPRRPLAEMEALAEHGLVQRRDGKLFGGINLGSIAISYQLLDVLLDEFGSEVNDASANRKDRPALDPEFFTALTIAPIGNPEQREQEWQTAIRENNDVAILNEKFPGVLARIHQAINTLETRKGAPINMVAMDFGDQFWGDIGQHPKIFDFYMSLNADNATGQISRAIAGIDDERDASGNIIVRSEISPEIDIRNSVLIDATLTGEGKIEESVLIGTHAKDIRMTNSFDVMSTVANLRSESHGGSYKVVSSKTLELKPDERATTLFFPDQEPQLFRIDESTDLRDKENTYNIPICGNPASFHEAHQIMGQLSVEELQARREKASESVQNIIEK